MRNIIQKEEFTSVQKAQSGLTKLLKEASKRDSFYRVMRNNEPIGVLMPDTTWNSFIEDFLALQSKNYIRMIESARKDKKTYSRAQMKKKLGIK